MSFLASELDEILRESGVADDVIEEFRMPWAPKPKPKARPRSKSASPQRSGYHHLGPAGRPRNVHAMSKEKLQHLASHPSSTDELRRMTRAELRRRGHHVPRIREAAYIEAWGRAKEHVEFPKFSRVHHPYQPELGGTVLGHRLANFRAGDGVMLHHVKWDRKPRGSEGEGKMMWEHPSNLEPHGASLREAKRDRPLRYWKPGDDVDTRSLHTRELIRGWRHHTHLAGRHKDAAELARVQGNMTAEFHHEQGYHHHRTRAARMHSEFARRTGRGLEVVTGRGGEMFGEAGVHPSRRRRSRHHGSPIMGVPSTVGIYRHPKKGSFLPARSRQNPMRAGSIVGFRHGYDEEYGIKGYRLARVVRNEHKRSGIVAIREPGGALHEIESRRITAVVPKHREREALDAIERERGLHNIHSGFMGANEKERRMRGRPKAPRQEAAIIGDYVQSALGAVDRELG
jgi:hypothetical protein